jgi:AraC-like DNA-binding protein
VDVLHTCLTTEPLHRYRIKSAATLRDACTFLDEHFDFVHVVEAPSAEKVGFIANAPFSDFAISYHAFDVAVSLNCAQPSDQFSLKWAMATDRGTESQSDCIRSPELFGSIISPLAQRVVKHSADVGWIAVRLPVRAVQRHLSTLLDDTPVKPLFIEPRIDLTSGTGAGISRLVYYLVDELGHPDSPLANPRALAQFQDILISAMLLGHSHNYMASISGKPAVSSSKMVRSVEEFLLAHASETVSMSDLPRIAGVGLRSIQATFRKQRGYSPTVFLRTARLDAARATLTYGGPCRVTDVAFGCGFAKLSSFAAAYRARFGELPSATLRRAAGVERDYSRVGRAAGRKGSSAPDDLARI